MRTALEQSLLDAFETHNPAGIQAAIDAGIDVREPIDNLQPITWLTEMYLRSPRFPACVRLLLQAGASIDDQMLRYTLLDDGEALAEALGRDPRAVNHRVTLRSAFTPLDDATLLHVAAEFGHVNAAGALIAAGADVNAAAATDAEGLNGQSPIFHTVNQHRNHGKPVMQQLIEAGAQLDVLLAGITWGRGFEWETTFFDLTPLSYAQVGLMPQVHRDQTQIYDTIRLLLSAQGRPVPAFQNVPNRYLNSD